ncbi:MAG: ferric reductase-like transmembrane domain-containing protein [Oceanobacter sp.]
MAKRRFWSVLVWLVGLAPVAWLLVQVVRLQQGEWDILGNEPGRAIVFFTGEWSFNFLVLTLAASSLKRRASFAALMPQRRKLGLFCFFYALLHALAYSGFLLEWQWYEILNELIERQYLTFGMLGLLLLLPLTVTSTKGWQRRLGKRWKSLHKAVYVVAVLVAVHYVLQIRSDWFWPTLYAMLVTLLLLERFMTSKLIRKAI